jgi:ABC-type dipeptide/oligopeptide/nickel transport system permease component
VQQPEEPPSIQVDYSSGQYEEVSTPTNFWATEVVRALLAYIFAFFLLIVITWGFYNSGQEEQVWMQTKELLQLLLPAITAILGSAIGFYYGTQKGP